MLFAPVNSYCSGIRARQMYGDFLQSQFRVGLQEPAFLSDCRLSARIAEKIEFCGLRMPMSRPRIGTSEARDWPGLIVNMFGCPSRALTNFDRLSFVPKI